MELGYSGETFSSQEDHKTFQREEFEKQLVDMGLELEKDEDVSPQLFNLLDSKQIFPCFCPHPTLSPFVFGQIIHNCFMCVLLYCATSLLSFMKVSIAKLAVLSLVGVGVLESCLTGS